MAAPPDEVALVFDGELSADGTGFTVTDANDSIVRTGELDLAVADRNEVRGAVEIALPGRYDVAWVAVALDGHEEAGEFKFTVGEPAQEQTPDTAVTRASASSSLLLGAIFVPLAISGGAMRRSVRAPVAAALALILGGCIGVDPECTSLPTRVELRLSADTLTPADPAVCRDRQVILVVTPEIDGVLHIHGYDEQVPATTVRAGQVMELAFTAARSGQFPIELHRDGDMTGVSVGTFTVHEP